MLVDLFFEIPQPNSAIFKLLLLSIDGEDNGDVEEEAFVDNLGKHCIGLLQLLCYTEIR